jgi:hypothetical protein
MRNKALLTAVLLSLSSTTAAAGCKLAYIEPPLGSTLEWTGACRNGVADGHGVLDIRLGKMVVLHYKGEIREGQLHGKGFMRRKDNEEYEGAFENDNPHGFGVASSRSGRYEGEWKSGRREGKGKMVFVLGGQYEGEWKNNRFHGLGTAHYPGGRKVTAQFVDGVRADLLPVPASDARYTLRSDSITGTHIRPLAIRNGVVPFWHSYAEMSDAERAAVRSWYPLLDDNDEPPYPIHGTAQMYKTILDVTSLTPVRGNLHIVVDVSESGDATKVTVHATPDPDLATIISYIAREQKYKPGKCAGMPCAMKFPLSVNVGAHAGSTDDIR